MPLKHASKDIGAHINHYIRVGKLDGPVFVVTLQSLDKFHLPSPVCPVCFNVVLV